MYGEGGAASKYCEQTATNEWSSGSTIIPLENEETKTWIEKNMPGEKYVEIFGEVSE